MELLSNTFEQGPKRNVIEHVFHFGENQIKAKLIACPHDDEVDVEFMKSALGPAEELGGKTIFIEQGSANNKGNMLGELKRIASEDPTIAEDFKKRQETKGSTLSDEFEQQTFAAVSNYALNEGAEVVNMDAALNSSSEVIDFLLNEGVPEEFIIEIYYGSIRNTTIAEEEIVPNLLIKLLPFSKDKIKEVSKRLYDFYHDGSKVDSLESIKRLSIIRDYWYYLREKFMLETLEKKLKDGDIVIAHPDHIDAILRQTQTLVEKPPIPELL